MLRDLELIVLQNNFTTWENIPKKEKVSIRDNNRSVKDLETHFYRPESSKIYLQSELNVNKMAEMFNKENSLVSKNYFYQEF